MRAIEYDRIKALEYAEKWAFGRNPAFYDFENNGGDCTNFISQCIFAGSGVMNYTPTFGWYYNSQYSRAPAWTGVQYLYNFLTLNRSVGPYGKQSDEDVCQAGDIIQLIIEGDLFHHSLIINRIENGEFFVATHTFDAFDRPLSTYDIKEKRFIHIIGARKWE